MTIDFGSRLYDLAWSTNICKMVRRLTHSSIERLSAFCQDAKPFHDVTTIKRSQGSPPYWWCSYFFRLFVRTIHGLQMQFSVWESSGKVWAGRIKPCNPIDGPWAMLHSRHVSMTKTQVTGNSNSCKSLKNIHCITSLRVTLFFCCVFQQQMWSLWSLKYQQVILRTKIYPNRGGCLMRTTWSRIWLTSGGIRHTHPCFVRPDCTVPKLCKKQDFSLRALLALWSVVRFCLSL